MITLLMIGDHYVEDELGVYKTYVCSSADSVGDLPTGTNADELLIPRPGSTAVVPDTNGGEGALYILTNERRWVFFTGGNTNMMYMLLSMLSDSEPLATKGKKQ